MTQKDKIIDIINNQKRELQIWNQTIRAGLQHQLNNKINKIDIFLIDKDWLDKYSKTFFDYKDNLKIEEAFLKFENIDNSKLSKEINENSKFYILNENCWLTLIRDRNIELEIKFEGYFLNNILLLIREPHFYFLYMDSNIIKKAYLKKNINKNNNIKDQIINLFKENNYIIDNIEKYISTIVNKIFNNNNLIITKDNSIFIYNNTVKGKINVLKHNKALSFNGNNDKNIYVKPNQISSNNKNNYKLKAIKVIDGNQKESEKENKKDLMNKINKIPKNYCHKKQNYKSYFNNNINNNNNNLKNNNIQSKIIKVEEKKKKDFNYELNKELFDSETRIKRNTSAQPKLVSKSRLRKKLDIFSNFFPNKAVEKKSAPGLIGLSKIEDSIPYMNAILQCFSNIKNLRIELLKSNIYEDLNTNKTTNKKISFALADVLKNLWKNLDQRIYKPNYFKNKISEINPYFNNKNYGEPKDLIKFLLDNIHNELNMPKSNINLLNQKIYYFYMFKNNYEDKNNSIISREFNGYLNTNEICLNCNYIVNTYFENFEILNFSMDDIRKMKNNNCNSINYNDCFDYYDREKYMTSYYCHLCGKNIIKKSKLYYLPPTLIINFKYGGRPEIEQNNISFEYNEFLDLKKYLNLNLNDSPSFYELIGVICLLKSNENEKHFVAFCKNSENCKWYKYNDDSVTLSSFGEISINTIPYVMFFSYIKT